MNKNRYFPSPELFKEMAGTSNTIPVYRDILADTETPVSAFMKIDDGGDAFLLESVEGGEKWGRYSFLGTGARAVIKSRAKTVEITEGGETRSVEGDPIEVFRDYMSRFNAAEVEGAPRFFGGAIGYLGYDVVRHIERLPDTAKKDLDVDDIYFIVTDTFLVFDNVENKIKVVCSAYIEEGDDPDEVYRESLKKIDALIERLRSGRVPEGAAPVSGSAVTSNFARGDFLGAVEKVKEYVRAGDVIQTVISQRFETPLDCEPFDIYRSLRIINPSPYMFFLRLGGTVVTGSSPEILVRVEGTDITVRPIAGTRPRGFDDDRDLALEDELLNDPKERAEHIMLVDLGRNDVGRVAKAGSVRVDELMAVERYSHVMHIVSNVRGVLADGLGSFDALRACFPAGTLTGAPKIRAMEIIEEMEPCKRGIYGGSIGYFDFSGNMDTCIIIRTVVIKDGMIYVQAGAGIVADSDPASEFEETENKAKGILKAVEMARRGLE